jgi:phosphatidylethanolamine-binding protein (PEBP) family uncharacterized protein
MFFKTRPINGATMKKSVLIFIIVVLVMGCAKDSNLIVIPKDAAEMDVEFSWNGIQACSHESPEIRVSRIPDGTEELQVQLKDRTQPAYRHGGGIVKHDGSGIIPAGALKIGYNGPCPPPGERHKYEFSVMAKNAEGVIIGFGKSRQSFPSKR